MKKHYTTFDHIDNSSNASVDSRVFRIEKKKQLMIETCTACGKCIRSCPVFTRGKYRYEKPRKVMLAVLDLLKEGIFSDTADYMAQTCTNCGDCTKRCAENLVPLLLFRAAVEKLEEIGRPLEPVSDFALLLRDLQIKEEDVFWFRGDALDTHTDTILFPGCDSVRAPHEIQTHIDILKTFGVSFITLWDEDLCCGFRGYSMNDFKEGDRLLSNFLSTVIRLGAKKIILSCGQCFNQLKKINLKKYSLDLEIIYFPQLIANLIIGYNFPNRINRKITFHDSCKTARGVKDFDSVRYILGMLPGIKIIEMEKSRENSLCCGGIKNFSYPEVTRGLLRERLTQAVKTGSDTLITDCTLCYSMYSILEEQFHLKVKHYSSIISEAMGLKPRCDTYKNILTKLTLNENLKVLYKTKLNEEQKGEYMKQIALFEDVVRRLRALPNGGC